MSFMASKFALLALASSAVAIPFAGEHGGHGNHGGHKHYHDSAVGVASAGTGAPYGSVNATGFDGTAAVQSTVTDRKTVYVTQTATAESSTHMATLYKKAWGEGKRRSRTTTTTAAAAAPTTTAAAAAVAPTTTTSPVAAATSVTVSSGSSNLSGKRGVAYNDAALTKPFEGSSKVAWGYNWDQKSYGLSSHFDFVPLLWGSSSTFTNSWSTNAQDAINNGATHLMAFNEPDLNTQSNMSPQAAAAAYKTYMQPFAGKAKLGAPAVTNGGGAMGLNWLDAFLDACTGCTIDFVSIHWYDSSSNTAYFKNHVANATAVAGGRPVWVTEFGCTDGNDAQISSFLNEVMPWMDQQSYVERYSYFMVANGLLVSGSEASSYGKTYMS